MARRTARPGRTLVAFFIGLAVAYGLVALAGTWKPALGLDLQGGTRITLIAKGNPTTENLNEARNIIDQRVNGSGVSEAEVVTEGSNNIVVEIPGDPRRDLTDTVERQAQLRFRMVACSSSVPGPCATGTTTDPTTGGTTTTPGSGVTVSPDDTATVAPSEAPSEAPSDAASPSGTASSANRAPAYYGTAKKAPSTSATPSESASASPSETASTSPSASTSATGATGDNQPIEPPKGGKGVDDPLTWMSAPSQEAITAFNSFTCPADGSPANVVDDPNRPLVTCGTGDDTGQKYLLTSALIEGDQLDSADAVIPQNSLNYVVSIDFDGAGTKEFTKISQKIVGTGQQFAAVLDGQVITAPQMTSLITNGQAQIEGGFTQQTATSLATSLKFGALPIAFEDPSTETIGPSLAGDQLNTGLIAGGIGLGLVLIYCMLYYRGLGIVVVSSLLAAGAVTYALVLLLSKTAGFTLTLPGIAGLIIAVGITADSFIIFFERIRDEMREGKTMRVAVESGWKRAKVTRLAAQVVSLLSAAVLYIFATGAVKGFGFALGLSTIVDLAILFWFTKPMVSWLARFKFYNSGHRLSGLSKGTLGIDGPAPRTATTVGGKA
jgi:preprotein translocase subunit SecD